MYTALDKTKEINSFKDVVIPSKRELFERMGHRAILGDAYSISASDEVKPISRSNNTIDQIEELQRFLNLEDSKKAQP